jgi:hypothetical protein
MTSILQTLGISAPNPAAYSDASSTASQMKQAIGGLQSSIAAANTALTFAVSSGLSSTTITKIQSNIGELNTLLSQSSTMTPATLTAATTKYNTELSVTQFNAIQEQYKTTLDDTKAIALTINKRVAEIRADKTTSSSLVSQYESLLNDVSGSIALLLASPPAAIVTDTTVPESGSGSGSGSGSSKTAYVVPTVPSKANYQDRLDNLDGLKEQEEGQGYTFSRMWRRFKNWAYVYLYISLCYVLIFMCAILGGILSSNSYLIAERGYTPNRIFYFVYGALGFPISILAGCVKPPFWASTLIPLSAYKAPVQSGGASTTSLLAAATTKSLTSVGLLPSGSIPGGTAARVPAAPMAPAAISGALVYNTKPKMGITDFIIDDLVANKPYAWRQKDKTTLWYLSLAAAASLATMATSYKLL